MVAEPGHHVRQEDHGLARVVGHIQANTVPNGSPGWANRGCFEVFPQQPAGYQLGRAGREARLQLLVHGAGEG